MINDFKIPITVFQANLKKYMNDPTIFPNPDSLIPERFMQTAEDGKTPVFKVTSMNILNQQISLLSLIALEKCIYLYMTSFQKNKRVVPFGIGKRVCLGESLANSELFIFFVMLLQRLRFEKPIEKPSPDPKKCSAGMTNVPHPFYVNVEKRKTI